MFDVLEPLDFETQPFYQLDISVMDGGAVPVKITMAINVVNVNEFPPVFTDTGKLFDGTEWYLVLTKSNFQTDIQKEQN